MIAIDGYRDLARIGQGGLGDVYRGRRDSTGGSVAIKVLRDVSDESVAWHRTRRELTALVALGGHGNVIQLLELLELAEGPALVMEYASGGSVADLLRERDGTLHPGEVVLVGRQTASALAAAHELGIVHRDVKPQNLLVDAYGQVKLCDFGIASLTRSDEFRARTNALSMRYASPEDLDDDAEGALVGPPSDVYSLGATLLHLLHGAPPSLKQRLAPWDPPPVDDDVVGDIDRVLSECLQPDPSRRPTAADLRDRLERIELGLPDRRRALPVDGAAWPDPAEVAPAPSPRTDDRPSPTAESRRSPSPSAPVGGRDGSKQPEVAIAPPPRAVPADEAPTAQRPDRPRGVERPAPDPPPRRRPVLVALVALVALAGVLVVVLWPRSDDDAPPEATATSEPTDATTTSPTTTGSGVAVVARPDGLDPIEGDGIVWPFGEPGECLAQVADSSELAVVGCDEPHDLQRFAVAELDTIAGGYDAGVVRVAIETACRQAFEPFVGAPYDAAGLDVPFTQPSASTWDDGDRAYQCFVGVPDRRLVGDAAGSGGLAMLDS